MPLSLLLRPPLSAEGLRCELVSVLTLVQRAHLGRAA